MRNPLPNALVWIIALSFFFHIAGFAFVINTKGTSILQKYGDAPRYTNGAYYLYNGYGFVTSVPDGHGGEKLEPQLYATPGVSILMLPFIPFTSGLVVYSALLTSFASLFIPYFVWSIGRRLFNEQTGLIAAGIIAFEPMLIMVSWFSLSEIPFILFTLGFIVSFLKSLEQERVFIPLLAGAIGGYAILIRPQTLILFVIAFAVLFVFSLRNRKKLVIYLLIGLSCLLILFPWYYRTHNITGVWSISGAGWVNVYTDYLSSIRSLNNGTEWYKERQFLQNEEYKKFGFSEATDIYDPANSKVIRNYALKEVSQNIPTVMRLEPALLFSYLTNDGWYYYGSAIGLIPRLPTHFSPTRALMDKKFEAIPQIFNQIKGQFFIPLVGRVVTVSILLLAFLGVWRGFKDRRYRIALLFALVITIAALSTTANGFGVEARFRLSITPLLFLLAAFGTDWLISIWKRKPTTI